MRHQAAIHLACTDEAAAAAAWQALGPEVHDGPPHTHAQVHVDGCALRIDLEAEDASGLRAAMQGLVRLADTAIRVAEGRP